MEFLIKIISFILLIGILVIPFIVLVRLKKKKGIRNFFVFLIISLTIHFTLIILSGWWIDISNDMFLNYYGFDIDAMNAIDRFKNVSVENMDSVKEIGRNRMGIGWPLKALFGFIVSSPYLLIVYLIGYLYAKYSKLKELESKNNG